MYLWKQTFGSHIVILGKTTTHLPTLREQAFHYFTGLPISSRIVIIVILMQRKI